MARRKEERRPSRGQPTATPSGTAGLRWMRWVPLAAIALAGLWILARDVLRGSYEPVAPLDWERVDAQVRPVLRKAYDAALQRPDSGDAHGRLAMVYEANKHWDEAARAYAIAARLDSGQPGWKLHEGIALAMVGRNGEALDAFDGARGHAATRAAASQRRGWVLMNSGDFEGARVAFEESSEAAPDRPEPRIGRAAALLRQERAEEARVILEDVLAGGAGDAQAHYLLGTAYRDLGRLDDARRELALGASSEPAFLPDPLTKQVTGVRLDSATRIDGALEMTRNGRAEDGLRILRQVYGESPSDPDSINNLAVAMFESGQAEEALKELERALELQPDAFQTWLNMGAANIVLARYEEALRCARQAARLAPDLSAPQLMIGKVLAHTDRAAEARPYLERAAALDTGNPDGQLLLGEVLMILKDLRGAHTALAAAARLRPDHLVTQVKLSWVAGELGLGDESRRALDAARRLGPGSAELAWLEGQLAGRTQR